uniref:Membrane protein UL56 n=1 Tax=Panagrellus redivivus TaxID=6233 RepID=A0A7E4ZRY1_PANRE
MATNSGERTTIVIEDAPHHELQIPVDCGQNTDNLTSLYYTTIRHLQNQQTELPLPPKLQWPPAPAATEDLATATSDSDNPETESSDMLITYLQRIIWCVFCVSMAGALIMTFYILFAY